MGAVKRWLTAFGLGLCLACSDEEARPPMAVDCNDPTCLDSRTGVAAMTTTYLLPTPGGGAAGAGGSGGGGEPTLTTLQGSVRMIQQQDLSGFGPPNSPVEVRAAGADNAVVAGAVGVNGEFSMAGVLALERAWVAVGEFSDPPSELFLDTYQVVNAAAARPVELAVMQRSVMEEIAQQSFAVVIAPQELEASRGQAIVEFVDEFGVPVSGVSITFPTLDDAQIAYDAGDSYSDALTATSGRGTAVLLNLPAAPAPGGLTSVVATVPTLPETEIRASFPVSAGAVTLYTIAVDLTP